MALGYHHKGPVMRFHVMKMWHVKIMVKKQHAWAVTKIDEV